MELRRLVQRRGPGRAREQRRQWSDGCESEGGGPAVRVLVQVI